MTGYEQSSDNDFDRLPRRLSRHESLGQTTTARLNSASPADLLRADGFARMDAFGASFSHAASPTVSAITAPLLGSRGFVVHPRISHGETSA